MYRSNWWSLPEGDPDHGGITLSDLGRKLVPDFVAQRLILGVLYKAYRAVDKDPVTGKPSPQEYIESEGRKIACSLHQVWPSDTMVQDLFNRPEALL